MNGLFLSLEDKDFFVKFVQDHYRKSPAEIAAVMACNHEIDDARIAYAHDVYSQNIKKMEVVLDSSNPDHYKRAGALLHALHQSEIITSVDLESNAEDLKAGFTRVHVGDAEYIVEFVEFYEVFHNQMIAFDLAYRCCAAYEENPIDYDFDYLHNMCRYLKVNTNVSVDSFFMIFKSLMRGA